MTSSLRGVAYADRLAFIGRQLDQGSVRSLVILEISGNFVIRTLGETSGEQHLSEVVPDDFAGVPSLPDGGPGAAPDSYEARLYQVGRDLDDRVAANISVIERKQSLQVVGWVHGEAAGRSSYVWFEQDYPG